jgi:hypothetical protein
MTVGEVWTIGVVMNSFSITDGPDFASYGGKVVDVLRFICDPRLTGWKNRQGFGPSNSMAETKIEFLKYLLITAAHGPPLFGSP